MTPAQQFAQKRSEAETLIREHAPARLQNALISLLRPAITLTPTRTDDAQIEVGASKFGGAPDVPADFEWPKWNELPLGFLAQIDLEEVAPFDVEGLLPKSGLLSFFYFLADEDWPYGVAEQKDGWRIRLFTEPLILREVPIAALNEYPFACARFSFEVTTSIPAHPGTVSDTQTSINDWPNWVDFAELYFPQDAHDGGKPQHQMLGYSLAINDDARYNAAQYSAHGSYTDWHLLLQLDFDEQELDFMWGDAGALFFLIHTDDLITADFANAWCIGDCS